MSYTKYMQLLIIWDLFLFLTYELKLGILDYRSTSDIHKDMFNPYSDSDKNKRS